MKKIPDYQYRIKVVNLNRIDKIIGYPKVTKL